MFEEVELNRDDALGMDALQPRFSVWTEKAKKAFAEKATCWILVVSVPAPSMPILCVNGSIVLGSEASGLAGFV